MTHPQVQGWDFDGTRIHRAHLSVARRGGIQCMSVYLYTCQGLLRKELQAGEGFGTIGDGRTRAVGHHGGLECPSGRASGIWVVRGGVREGV